MLRIRSFLACALVVAGCGGSEDPGPAVPAGNEPRGAANRTVLVTGATGTQGGAVARELLDRGYAVRALTRDPEQPAAAELRRLGAEVVAGDFNEPQSLRDAMRRAHGVFAVTTWQDEVAQGRNLVDAAEASGITHFIYTSVAGADENTGLPHFDNKYEVEKYLAASSLNYSIVRPVEFMNNWEYSRDALLDGRYVNPRDGSDSHQWIAARDIGYFVGEAFDNPSAWYGRTEEIAGDEMTLDELVAVMSGVLDRPVEHVEPPWPDFRAAAGDEVADMYRWFADVGYDVDVDALRARHPNLTTVREFLEEMFADAG